LNVPPHDAFFFHAELFHDPTGRWVVAEVKAIDPLKAKFLKSILHHSLCGLGAVPVAPILHTHPITDFRPAVF
jgi:hypothetical protein